MEKMIRTKKKMAVGSHASRMNLIYAVKDDKDESSSYRPFTVSSVTYKMVMQAIKLELSK